MAPDYKELGAQYNVDSSKVKIAKIDSTVHKEFSAKHGVEGFPTLKLFINGEPVDYSGERTKASISSFISHKIKSEITVLKTKKEVEEQEASNFAVIFLLPENNEKLMKTVLKFSRNYDAFQTSVVYDKTLLPMTISTDKALILLRKFDDGNKVIEFADELAPDFIKQFVNSHRFPIVQNFDQDAANRIFGDQHSAFFYFDDNVDSETTQIFKTFAKQQMQDKNYTKLIFSTSTITTGFGAKLSEYLGLGQNEPCARIIDFNNQEIVKYKVEDLTADGFAKAITDYEAKLLQPYFKSEPIPEKNDQPVKVLVANGFEQMVANSGKFVLVEIYAPWCGHCKALEPIYKELAEKLAHLES